MGECGAPVRGGSTVVLNDGEAAACGGGVADDSEWLNQVVTSLEKGLDCEASDDTDARGTMGGGAEEGAEVAAGLGGRHPADPTAAGAKQAEEAEEKLEAEAEAKEAKEAKDAEVEMEAKETEVGVKEAEAEVEVEAEAQAASGAGFAVAVEEGGAAAASPRRARGRVSRVGSPAATLIDLTADDSEGEAYRESGVGSGGGGVTGTADSDDDCVIVGESWAPASASPARRTAGGSEGLA
jgi:hypothetical protein